ncbi:hypothetical protein PYJP_03850 [Pyrofollis japonicus]|uniref:GNAT family N-acetyltransferase n=1 Tax=Pyrofollis japonicus TaxID=3060460 RepID=UPI00295BCEFB|nr:N-acetyltransferase [Pyrofollis japonicus]BEP17033.1 hypothetical protein PYJP_03850 [Pyrofollis japonicus]
MHCGILVRNADKDDLDQVYVIELESFNKPYPRWYLDILYSLSGNGDSFLVSFDDNGYVDGYIVAVPLRGGVCHIASIAVRKDCRRRKVGTALLQSLFELCEEKGFQNYLLEVSYMNTIAQLLYVRNSFAYIGFIRDYYGKNDHALVMLRTGETRLWRYQK